VHNASRKGKIPLTSSRDPRVSVADPASARAPLASWYAPGATDGFGDRLLMFDNAATGPLELLRIRPDFSFHPAFEPAVRSRFNQLSSLTHAGFAHARAVNQLDEGEGLTVASTHVPGTRLSELFRSTRAQGGMHPASARWVLGELVTSLAELHRGGSDVAHGALAPERIVITPDRHVVVTDYVFGDALARMRVPADRLWTEFGLISPAHGGGLDQRSDVVQLGVIVMSLVLGRLVLPTEYPGQLHKLLDEFSAVADKRGGEPAAALRGWLERALAPAGYRSAVEAEFALLVPAGLPDGGPKPARRSGTVAVDGGSETPIPGLPEAFPAGLPAPAARTRPVLRWMVAGLSVLAVGQAAVIGRLMMRSAPAQTSSAVASDPEVSDAAVLVDGYQPGVTATGTLEGGHRAIQPVAQGLPMTPGAVLAISRPAGAAGDPSSGAATAVARTGGVRVVSPIALDIIEGERVLGSSANGPVFASPGVHELELINNALGYRTRQSVRVVAGRVIALQIEPPSGSVSINAQPWAQVWIDGQAVGDTPLANLTVPPGEHEVLFRHPQLGERRQKTIVRVGALTRVSATMAPDTGSR
jgi:hypothetical protein